LEKELNSINKWNGNFEDLEMKYELLKKAVSEYDRKIKILFDENNFLTKENKKLNVKVKKTSSINRLILRRSGLDPEIVKSEIYKEIGFFGSNEKFRAGVKI